MISLPRLLSAKLIVPLACVLLSGCIIVKKPLTDPATSEVDKNILGVWKEVGYDNSFLFVGKSDVKDNPVLMRAVQVVYSNLHESIFVHNQGYFSLTKIGKETYANIFTMGPNGLVNLGDEKSYGRWASDPSAGIYLMKYAVNGDRLVVWLSQDTDVTKFLSAAKERGELDTDNPISMVNYLRKTAGKTLFVDGKETSYVRMTK